jgi:hypothetical protein
MTSGDEFDDEDFEDVEDAFWSFVSSGALDILRGRLKANTRSERLFYAGIHRHWERTGLKDEILSKFTAAQIKAAIDRAWVYEWSLFGCDWAKQVRRRNLLDKNIADQTERNQAQAAKDYADIRAVYAQLVLENPALAKKANGKARNVLISKRLGKANSPGQIKQIQRALRGMK